MRELKLDIERPDLFLEVLQRTKVVSENTFLLQQNSTKSNLFEGKISSDNISLLLKIGQQYGYKLFMSSIRLSLTDKRVKVSEILLQNNRQNEFLGHISKIKLLDNSIIELNLSFLGFAESSQFDRIFTVMSDKDRFSIEQFVGIKEHHYKTSFRHSDFNLSYRILGGNLLFFKHYHNNQRIELDSLIGIEWKK
jgi:hypothetical protein